MRGLSRREGEDDRGHSTEARRVFSERPARRQAPDRAAQARGIGVQSQAPAGRVRRKRVGQASGAAGRPSTQARRRVAACGEPAARALRLRYARDPAGLGFHGRGEARRAVFYRASSRRWPAAGSVRIGRHFGGEAGYAAFRGTSARSRSATRVWSPRFRLATGPACLKRLFGGEARRTIGFRPCSGRRPAAGGWAARFRLAPGSADGIGGRLGF